MITLDVRGRCTGKTYGLVQMLIADPTATLLVDSAIRKGRLCHQYKLEKDVAKRILVLSTPSVIQGTEGPVYFDDIDLWLDRVFQGRLRCATMSAANVRITRRHSSANPFIKGTFAHALKGGDFDL